MDEYSNSDIMRSQNFIKSELAEIKQQVKYINSRVSVLEQWVNDYKVRKDERAKMRAETVTPVVRNAESVNITNTWWSTDAGQKLIIGIASIATAVAIYITIKSQL